MKQYKIIALAALTMLGLASCDEYTLPNPPAQTVPEEPVFDSSKLVFNNAVSSNTINLPALAADKAPVELFTLSMEDFPASYNLEVIGEFFANDLYEGKSMEMKASVTDGLTVTMNTGDFQTIFNTVVSKDLVAKPLFARYIAYAVNGNSRVRLGGPEYYYWAGQYTVTPLPQENVIEPVYYLVGNFCNWDIAKALPMKQLNEGNPYDNPDFTIKIDVDKTLADSDAGYQWKVLPASAVANGNMNAGFGAVPTSEKETTTGNLLPAEGTERAGEIRQEGPYMISINMETRKYKVEPAFDFLWVPGMATATADNKFDKVLRLATGDYINYEGTMPLRSRFWFTGQASTKGVSFRPNGDQEDGEDGSASGLMIYDVTSNAMMKVPLSGTNLYYVKANVVTLKWSITPIPQISIIGGYNGWDTATAVDLTPDKNNTVWTLNDFDLPEGEFKFCVSHDWALSFGGVEDNIVQNGGNLKITEAGTFDISLNFGIFPATLTLTRK